MNNYELGWMPGRVEAFYAKPYAQWLVGIAGDLIDFAQNMGETVCNLDVYQTAQEQGIDFGGAVGQIDSFDALTLAHKASEIAEREARITNPENDLGYIVRGQTND